MDISTLPNVNSPELDYNASINNHSSVIYRALTPQGSSSITLGTTSGVVGPVEFILPSCVQNWAKSRLTFQIDCGATVSGGTGTTNLRRWFNANIGTMLNRVVVYDSATSAVIADVSNFDKYSSMIPTTSENIQHYLGKQLPSSATALLPWTGNGSTAIATALANSLSYPQENICRSNLLATANFSGVTTNVVNGNDYTGRRMWFISPAQTNDGDAVYLSVSTTFEDLFRFTALSLDKNVYLPSNCVLQLYFNPNDSFQFACTSAVDATTPVSIAVGATVSNLKVQLATEANISIIAQTIDLVMQRGLTLPVFYPTVIRNTFSTTTAPSFQIQLTSGYSKRIVFLATSPFNLSGTGINLNNVHNAPRASLTQYQSTLNSVAIKTPAGFDCTRGEDWSIGNSVYFAKTPLQNLDQYIKSDWVHIDSFFGEKSLADLDMTMVDGISVAEQSQTYGFQATTASTAQTWITVIVGQKMLSFTKMGAVIV